MRSDLFGWVRPSVVKLVHTKISSKSTTTKESFHFLVCHVISRNTGIVYTYIKTSKELSFAVWKSNDRQMTQRDFHTQVRLYCLIISILMNLFLYSQCSLLLQVLNMKTTFHIQLSLITLDIPNASSVNLFNAVLMFKLYCIFLLHRNIKNRPVDMYMFLQERQTLHG